MREISSKQSKASMDHPVFVPECTEEVAHLPAWQDRVDAAPLNAEAGSFLDLLADLERGRITENRRDIIVRYQAWIGQNRPSSTVLYGAWFNLGVELAAAGDKAGAIDAYHNALTLRPGFYPAAINLGTIMESTGQPEEALAIWQQALQPEEARAALLDYRNCLAEVRRIEQQNSAKVLHVSHAHGREKLPPVFCASGWQEIRVDIDPAVRSEMVATMSGMHDISDGLVDAVYSPHTINHLYAHEVPLALQEMRRVLKPAGLIFITLPDLQEVARYVAEGKLEDPLYMSPLGPVAPFDILYGYRPAVASGHASAAPRIGFTSATLGSALIKAGFAAVMVQRGSATFCLTAIAFRSTPDKEQLARAQAQMLPAADHPAVLYTPSG
jgi:tetratricopeptide (TPR) repeat protein